MELEFQTFDMIYQKYADTIFRIAVNYTKNMTTAEDIMQEVFLRYLYHSQSDDMSEEYQKAWFIRVTINLCKDEYKSSWNKKRADFNEYESCISDGIHTQEERELYQLINQLPQEGVALILLHYVEGYTLAETARLLGLKLTTVASKINKAKKQLKLALEAEEQLQMLLKREECPDKVKQSVKERIIAQVEQDAISKVTYIDYLKPKKSSYKSMLLKTAVACVSFVTISLITVLLLSHVIMDESEIHIFPGGEDFQPFTKKTKEVVTIVRIDPSAVVIKFREYQLILPMKVTTGCNVGDQYNSIDYVGSGMDAHEKVISSRLNEVSYQCEKRGDIVQKSEYFEMNQRSFYQSRVEVTIAGYTYNIGNYAYNFGSKLSYEELLPFVPNDCYLYESDFVLDVSANLPDENGIVESEVVPELMQPGTIISFIDDTHYTFICGGPYEFTPETLLAEYQADELRKKIANDNNGIIIKDEEPYAGMHVIYSDYGEAIHNYDFTRIVNIKDHLIENNIDISSQQFTNTQVDENDIKKIKIDMEYPKLHGQKQYSKINQIMDDFISNEIKAGEECLSSYDWEQLVVGVDCDPFEWDCDYEVTYNYNGMLGVQFNGYYNTGGVHPNTSKKCFLFDLGTGEQILLSDLVTVDEKTFQEHIYSLFEQEKISAESTDVMNCFTTMDLSAAKKLINFDMKFTLTTQGIRFYFNPYEVNNYAAGCVELVVGFDDLIFEL